MTPTRRPMPVKAAAQALCHRSRRCGREYVPGHYRQNAQGQDRWQPPYWRMPGADQAEFLARIKHERLKLMSSPEMNFLDEELLGSSDLRAALNEMKAGPLFLRSERMLKQLERANWYCVTTEMASFAGVLMQWFHKRDVPLFVVEALRSQERQRELYLAGKSKVEQGGAHTRGAAVDIIHATKGYELTPAQWRVVEAIGLRVAAHLGLAVTWGGSWGWDMAHWELQDWKQRQVVTMPHLSLMPGQLAQGNVLT